MMMLALALDTVTTVSHARLVQVSVSPCVTLTAKKPKQTLDIGRAGIRDIKGPFYMAVYWSELVNWCPRNGAPGRRALKHHKKPKHKNLGQVTTHVVFGDDVSRELCPLTFDLVKLLRTCCTLGREWDGSMNVTAVPNGSSMNATTGTIVLERVGPKPMTKAVNVVVEINYWEDVADDA